MHFIKFLLLFVSFCSFEVQAQMSKYFDYEIGEFYHFKHGAISLTFDDEFPSQFTIGLKIIDSLNIKGTFFITPASVGESRWHELREMVKRGHEIGAHSIFHPHLTNIDIDKVHYELQQSKYLIEQNIEKYSCISFAYPFGESNKNVRDITSLYFQGARTTDGGLFPVNASYFYKIPAYWFSSKTKLESANKWVIEALHSKKWVNEVYHIFDVKDLYSITSSFYLKHLQFIKSKEKYLWITTFGNAIRYFKERQAAKVELIDSSYNFYKINITDDLIDSIFNFPLSLKVRIPNNWNDVMISQSDQRIAFTTDVDVCKNKYVFFDAVPDKGVITINSIKISDSDSLDCEFCELVASPNPFTQTLSIMTKDLVGRNIRIYGPKGQLIYQSELKSDQLKIDTSSWLKGVYIVSVQLDNLYKIFKKTVIKI